MVSNQPTLVFRLIVIIASVTMHYVTMLLTKFVDEYYKTVYWNHSIFGKIECCRIFALFNPYSVCDEIKYV